MIKQGLHNYFIINIFTSRRPVNYSYRWDIGHFNPGKKSYSYVCFNSCAN